MKKINELRFIAACVILGACLLIGVCLKFADAIDRLAEPENCEMEHDEPHITYTLKGIPQYESVWRGHYNVTKTVTNQP
jgi:hypothetical protein